MPVHSMVTIVHGLALETQSLSEALACGLPGLVRVILPGAMA